jgi:hypothetical protein
MMGMSRPEDTDHPPQRRRHSGSRMNRIDRKPDRINADLRINSRSQPPEIDLHRGLAAEPGEMAATNKQGPTLSDRWTKSQG